MTDLKNRDDLHDSIKEYVHERESGINPTRTERLILVSPFVMVLITCLIFVIF